MRRLLCILTLAALCLTVPAAAANETGPALEVAARSAVLMEKETGTLLYEKEAHVQMEPASVTKVMTLLLVMEAVDSGRISLDDTVTVSAVAAGMGGSQVYMKENEQFTVSDMLKCICVVSANDACVAMAEHLCGSEMAFVSQMNQRASELGMADTVFRNCTGLPEEGHVTSAHDIAIMSRELILNHPGIRTYTTIWMDSIRDGAFQLANTNKLVRYYEGATGLKTGSTDAAGYCLSGTAERDGMELIAVVLGSPTSGDRFTAAQTLLNYGFSTYALVQTQAGEAIPPVQVLLGEKAWVQPVAGDGGCILVRKEDQNAVTTRLELAETVEAPVDEGQKLGEIVVLVNGEERARIPLTAHEEVGRLGFPGVFARLVRQLLMAG